MSNRPQISPTAIICLCAGVLWALVITIDIARNNTVWWIYLTFPAYLIGYAVWLITRPKKDKP